MDRVTRNVTVTAASVRPRRSPSLRGEGGKGKTRSVDFNEIPGKRNTAAKEENGRPTPRGKGIGDASDGRQSFGRISSRKSFTALEYADIRTSQRQIK